MPAMLDDPESPTIHRVSGALPYPDPNNPSLPPDVRPRQVTLRDRQTVATIVPFVSKDQVPPTLLKYLSDQLAKEVEGGDTYPMIDPMPCDKFSSYWFQNFAAIMLLGDISSPEDVIEGKDWSKECLGSFYIKPNYPGRSSHVCNAGFLVTDASRNRGAGRLMGESYIDWAPKLGYSYSVFNLVYETNVASCKIWDALGFKRIGRVKGCGRLKSYPDRLVDAIIYGRDLVGDDAEGPVSEDRFDKIKFYLKHGRYPDGSNRADKSRLRSAATHYKLLDNDVLMLKGKEVISDPARQMDIAKRLHEGGSHSGINKTTATIAERYHWSRIKETVSDVIRLCPECKESSKVSVASTSSVLERRSVPGANLDDLNMTPDSVGFSPLSTPNEAAVGMGTIEHHHSMTPLHHANANPYANPGDIASLLNPVHPLEAHDNSVLQSHSPMLQDQTHDHMTQVHRAAQAASVLIGLHDDAHALYQPIDPQIISQAPHQHNQHHHFHTFDPPHIIPSHHSPHVAHSSLSDGSYDPHLQVHHTHHQEETESFQALLDDPDPLGSGGGHHDDGGGSMQVHPNANDQEEQDQAAVDRDLDMLLDPDSDSDDIEDLGFCSPSGGGGSGTGKHASPSPGAEKRDRHDAVETDRSAKRRNWDSVVFDDDP